MNMLFCLNQNTHYVRICVQMNKVIYVTAIRIFINIWS